MAHATPDQKILRKTGISKKQTKKKKKKKKKKIFYPKMKFFHITGKILCLMKTILRHTQNHANSTFFRVKGTQIWLEKEVNPLRG